MQNEKKKRGITVELSNEAYITARVLSSMSGVSMKQFLSQILENYLKTKKREALTKIVETLQTNNNQQNPGEESEESK
jgi:hypothetical protein